MTLGAVYIWEPCESEFTGGRVKKATVPMLHLDPAGSSRSGISGRYVEVINAGRIKELDAGRRNFVSLPIGNASPDAEGNFIYDPEAGGDRLGKLGLGKSSDRDRYIAASHFGEVNTYFHITRIAERIDKFLQCLGEKSLPKVRAFVNAHKVPSQSSRRHGAARDDKGVKWLPARGAQYRLSSNGAVNDTAHQDIWHSGEIHFGPGAWWTREGWLSRIDGTAYRCNNSHIVPKIYQAYGRHIIRHTADFQANALRAPHRQDNIKLATESAVSDYWAASMLGTPHIWCWHHRDDIRSIHPRSLASPVTMADFDGINNAVAHQKNGVILAAALWDLRQALGPQNTSACDLLVLTALINIGRLVSDPYRPNIRETRHLRDGFPAFAACLLFADKAKFGCRYASSIRTVMERRRIAFCDQTLEMLSQPTVPPLPLSLAESSTVQDRVEKIRVLSSDAIIPNDDELLHPDALEIRLQGDRHEPYDLVAVGDVMPGGRMRRRINEHGPNFPFAWVKPVFQRAAVIMGNLEGPFARHAKQEMRNFSYKVDPKLADVLRRAGFNVMTLANNHLQDCGREGVRETIETLTQHGIEAIGGGPTQATAHDPAIMESRGCRMGLLGYYWNRRTSAVGDLPGSARDLTDLVERDLKLLKPHVDRVVVTVHWGIPYERQPSAEDRAKARHFIDCGADIVIGHHPHIIQPFEVYRGRPIFYSVGNFAFGSGNSRAESLLLGVRFLEHCIDVDVFPAYVRNRDPRLDYQPKLMCGEAATQTLGRLASISGEDGKLLEFNGFCGRLRV